MTNTHESTTRNSWKFRAKSNGGIDMPVYGVDEADAEQKFREFFNLTDQDVVEVWQVGEFTNLPLRLN